MDERARGIMALQEVICPTPEDEFRKHMMEGVCNVVKGAKESPLAKVCFPTSGKEALTGC
jgi:hypothetical protein